MTFGRRLLSDERWVIDVFAATAEETPPIRMSSSVNYTDFFQVLLYFLHVTLMFYYNLSRHP